VIAHGGVEGRVRKDVAEHGVDSVDRVELVLARLIPDVVSGQITGVVDEVDLSRCDGEVEVSESVRRDVRVPAEQRR
jgi:hypothetical protein